MAAWVFVLLCALAPPAKLAALPAFPGWAETAEQRTDRYRAIAEDIAAVTPDTRELAVLVAIAIHESGLAPDVDLGPTCYRGPRGDGPRCDFGKAVSIFQIHADGEDAKLLIGNRRTAAKRALALMRRSARACVPKHGPEAALRIYASGTCEGGAKASTDMVKLARRLLTEHPPPKQQE